MHVPHFISQVLVLLDCRGDCLLSYDGVRGPKLGLGVEGVNHGHGHDVIEPGAVIKTSLIEQVCLTLSVIAGLEELGIFRRELAGHRLVGLGGKLRHRRVTYAGLLDSHINDIGVDGGKGQVNRGKNDKQHRYEGKSRLVLK